ncbi:MAG: M28 family peptidase, partial [Fibrella sp.]|nr:M28 family peptidase [Armatimonadota bacterium]
LSAIISLSAPAFAAGTLGEKDAKKSAEFTITQRNLRSYLTFIASDELEGRDTPSNGLDTAARYIATFLDRWGFVPKGDNGTYFQKITIRSLILDGAKSTATVAGKTLRYGDDFLVNAASLDNATIAASTPLVFVGHGWLIKSKNIDAYKGLDVRGKIVVVAPGLFPPTRDLTTDGMGTDWLAPSEYAAKNGALGIIELPRSTDPEAWGRRVASTKSPRRVQTEPVSKDSRIDNGLPSITLSPTAAAALFAGEKITLDTALADPKTKTEAGGFVFGANKSANLAIGVQVEDATTQNVVAVWEGSDARLKNQYVALGAHYDHIGIRTTPDASGDRINNGADDDGSGTVALLSMAEALGSKPENRPKRSILFVWHCGEEKGLWGSKHFTENPTVPITDIVTQINIDMIGRSKPDANDTQARNRTLSDPNTIYVIGSRMLSTELGEVVDKVNRDYTKLSYDLRYDDPKDPNRFYYRSDHYNYAQRGIPIAFFFDGVHVDYHRPSDEVDKIDFPKYERVTRTIFLTAVAVANRDKAPALKK